MEAFDKCPCTDCEDRKYFARNFDIHVWGDDCPWRCDAYEAWVKAQDSESDPFKRQLKRYEINKKERQQIAEVNNHE